MKKSICLLLIIFFFFVSSIIPILSVKGENQTYIVKIVHNQESGIKVTSPEFEKLTIEKIEKIANLPQVKYMERNLGTWFYSQDLKLPDTAVKVFPITQIDAYGISSQESLYLKENIMKLVEGRSFTEEEYSNNKKEIFPLMVSNEWSKKNGLSVGDIISLDANVYYIKIPYENNNWSEVYTEKNLLNKTPYSFEIVGIFEVNDTYYQHFSYLKNIMIIPEHLAEKVHFNYQLIEHANYEKHYSHEKWWQETRDLYPVEKEKMFDTPFFKLESELDFLEFESAANKILSPCYKTQVIFNN